MALGELFKKVPGGGWWNWDPSELFGLYFLLSYLFLLHYTYKLAYPLLGVYWNFFVFCALFLFFLFLQLNFTLIIHNFGLKFFFFFETSYFLYECFIACWYIIFYKKFQLFKTTSYYFHFFQIKSSSRTSFKFALLVLNNCFLAIMLLQSFFALINIFFWNYIIFILITLYTYFIYLVVLLLFFFFLLNIYYKFYFLPYLWCFSYLQVFSISSICTTSRVLWIHLFLIYFFFINFFFTEINFLLFSLSNSWDFFFYRTTLFYITAYKYFLCDNIFLQLIFHTLTTNYSYTSVHFHSLLFFFTDLCINIVNTVHIFCNLIYLNLCFPIRIFIFILYDIQLLSLCFINFILCFSILYYKFGYYQ